MSNNYNLMRTFFIRTVKGKRGNFELNIKCSQSQTRRAFSSDQAFLELDIVKSSSYLSNAIHLPLAALSYDIGKTE